MATVDANSTLREVQAAFDDAASYFEDNDAEKAKALVTAGMILLRRIPSSTSHGNEGGNESVTVDLEVVRRMVDEARRWLTQSGYGTFAGAVRHADLRGFRE